MVKHVNFDPKSGNYQSCEHGENGSCTQIQVSIGRTGFYVVVGILAVIVVGLGIGVVKIFGAIMSLL